MLVRTRPDEPIGRLVVQAMACGVPVVGPAVGRLLDAVVEGATGVLVPPEDPRALAAALQALVTDPLRREGYGLAAVERARTRYPWARLAEETERAYARAGLRRSGNGAAEAALPGADAAPAPTGS
ncbi:MAG TPA: glycosyltransferase [Jiangellales bacterium]|nr:glycosyltransferase [Jiangellales bacterium]